LQSKKNRLQEIHLRQSIYRDAYQGMPGHAWSPSEAADFNVTAAAHFFAHARENHAALRAVVEKKTVLLV